MLSCSPRRTPYIRSCHFCNTLLPPLSCSPVWRYINYALQMKRIALFSRPLAWAPWLVGGIGLVVVTFVGYWLGANVGIASYAYLIIVALLSLMGSLTAPLAFSIAAALCLSYFFAPPIFSFWIEHASDAALLIAFLTAAIIIATLLDWARGQTAPATNSKHALGTALDEKQAVEASRRRSENYLAQAQQLSRTGSFGWTPSTREVHWSDETFRIYELDRNVKPTLELALQRIYPDDRAFVRQAIDETSRGERELDLTHRLLMADGSVKYVQVSSRTVKDAAGNLEVVGALMEVTERKVQEQAQARLAAIVSSSDAAIVGKTLAGVVTSWNAGAESIFGYKAHEMIGQSITRIIPPELQKEEKEILRRIQQGDRIKNYQTVRNCKDGRRIDISLTISPVLDQSGNVVGASKIARDITAERRAEAELHQIRAELARVARMSTVGELTATIAHEINQPLAGVVNSGNACLRWLSSEPPDVSAARKSSERVIAAGERAAEVIKRVRALVEKTPPQREQFNINDAISEVLALIPGEIQRNSISLSTNFANDLPFILADRIQLQQVILNLVLNAIEAMSGVQSPRDLLVASTKSESNDGVLVTVLDSGTGLDEKSLDRLFEPFYTTKAHGMGIGLAVSRTIIQTHGGLLWARPNSPRGAVFAFNVPGKSKQVS